MTTLRHTQPMLPPGTFQNQTIVITGGGTGLGRSMGQYLLSLGARLAICGRRRDVVEQTAAEMTSTTSRKVKATVVALACSTRVYASTTPGTASAQITDRKANLPGVFTP